MSECHHEGCAMAARGGTSIDEALGQEFQGSVNPEPWINQDYTYALARYPASPCKSWKALAVKEGWGLLLKRT